LGGSFVVDKRIDEVVSPAFDSTLIDSFYRLVDSKFNESLVTSLSATTASGTTSYEGSSRRSITSNTNADPNDFVYIYNLTDLQKLKARGKKANEITEPIMSNDGTIGGHKAFPSSFVPAGKAYIVVGSRFGKTLLISDCCWILTLAANSQNRIVVTIYGDAKIDTTFAKTAMLVA